MFLKGIGALILGLYIGLNAEYSEIKPVIPEYTENVQVKEFEGKKYYIIREDYAGEYDIQEFGFPTFNVPDDVEQQKVMSFEEYKKYCEKFNLKQKYFDEYKKYIVVTEAFGGAAYVNVRLADIEIKEEEITLYAWVDANGVVGNTSAYTLVIPIEPSVNINKIRMQDMYTSKCFDELAGILPNFGANYTIEDNKALAENTYLKSDNTEANEVFNKMIDAIIKKRTMQVKKDGKIIEYIDFNTASSSFFEDYYSMWGYIAYGEEYGESYTPAYRGEAYSMGYGGVPTADKMLYYEALINDLVMIIANNTEENPYYEKVYRSDFFPLVDVTNCTVALEEEKNNYIIVWNAENEGTERYYINKKTYLLEKTINTRNVVCEYEYANIPVKIPDEVAKNAYPEEVSYKPIIYLYPTEEKEVLVELKSADKLTCSYPEYEAGWNVIAKPNGDLQDLKTGRNLYSLYYENENVVDFDIENDGFIVKGEDIASFLEEKLAILGLTEREANEFIIYWLPVLQENKYNYIRFATEAEINQNMPLNITPTPDTTVRVLMTYKGLEEPIEVEEQILVTPERNGFVAVEWGGTEIK